MNPSSPRPTTADADHGTESLEEYFAPFRQDVIGHEAVVHTPFGTRPLRYADAVASGRASEMVEDAIRNHVLPFMANTHTDANATAERMTAFYEDAKEVIREHVKGSPDDVVLTVGSGMTGAMNRLQRILGLRHEPKIQKMIEGIRALSDESRAAVMAVPGMDEILDLVEMQKPVVFVTHMEHHSNHTSWFECDVDVVILMPNDETGEVSVDELREQVEKYKADGRPMIGSFTDCSNVTGIRTPIREMAKVMHENGGLCFADFAASAPYVDIDMHPEGSDEDGSYFDAVLFSPHKFQGGPGSTGVAVFNRSLYQREVPVNVGGGTVTWTSPFDSHRAYIGSESVHEIEAREDAGTPPILQAIRAAMAIKLKEKMGVKNIAARKKELLSKAMLRMKAIDGMSILDGQLEEREGIISFVMDDLHYNLVVQVLNDYRGVQQRGGCACAGTYGHLLYKIGEDESQRITCMIDEGDLSEKPGFVRLSLHPTMSDDDLEVILSFLEELAANPEQYTQHYVFNNRTATWKYDGPVMDVDTPALPSVRDVLSLSV